MSASGIYLPALARHFLRAKWRWATLRGDALARYQDERARRIVAYADAHSPFYHRHWAGHSLSDWRALPTVDKRLMMDHFDDFNTRGLSRDMAMEVALAAERTRDFAPTLAGITIGLSSGTSGHRGLFLANPEEQAGWAGTILARALHRLPRGRLRVAFFLRSNSNLYEQVGGTVIQFRYFDLMTPLDEAVARLNLLQPHIVLGPPSLLGFLADAREAGRLRIHPQWLISVAEVLEPQDRERLADVFRAPIHQIYQCTEGLLAVSCARGALHIQEDLVALQLEPLDSPAASAREDIPATVGASAGRPTAPGAASLRPGSAPGAITHDARYTPIVTDLWRRTQPIIRYRLNDVLRLAPAPCPCGAGFRALAAVEGRSDDVCYFERVEGGQRPFFPDTIRRMVLLASPGITDYQAIQERPGHLRISLALAPGMDTSAVDTALRRGVRDTLASYGCRPVACEITHELAPRAPDAKRRRVQRLMR